jgi:hypothetical protein
MEIVDTEPQDPRLCLDRAKEYSDKAAATIDPKLRAAFGALAREYVRRAMELLPDHAPLSPRQS